MNVQGKVVHETSPPIPRSSGAGRPDIEELRRMLAERQGKPRQIPTDGNGQFMKPSFDGTVPEKVPALPAPNVAPPRPSYAKPVERIASEGREQLGRGEPAPGGFKV